ncbi:MAG: glutamine--tRNA ligase/YqeY domain fusion protein [Caldilineales bacterium]|nr:glutamine--tRNA ligase/YqeY domain fusion protein [Caldilineales bacterium]
MSTETITSAPAAENRDFIREIVTRDNTLGTYGGQVVTRFPPEPNGYLHIGHAKSICLNFGVALENGGRCHLRFDDTNPTTEDVEYVDSIQEAIHWLGFDWGEHLYYASDYFEQLYQFAEQLILDGKAYVDSLNEEEIREYRGTVTEPGKDSPYRERTVAENLDLFRRMRAGEFPDGAHVLRARIDMTAPNMILRDPILYRIRHAHHYRTGDEWCIYPLYDFAHPLSDAIEQITHSICTLEFENNRAIYNWLTDNLLEPPVPHQYEFARLSLDYTVMSKRKLLQLVTEGLVDGWDDPRMPTLVGFRRRGVRPEAIRNFCDLIGVAKMNSRVSYELLEYAIRDDLNTQAPRVMCVLKPLKIVITNYPEGQTEWLDASYWPHDVPRTGSRQVPFSRELFIEQEDFSENPPAGWRRLSPGEEVRLRHSYVIRCDAVEKDSEGEIIALHCTYDPNTLGENPTDRRIRSAIHWVSAAHALPAEVRIYERLFVKPNPDDVEEGKSFKDYLNPDSLTILQNARVEPSVADDPVDTRYQFERQGFFVQDRVNSRPDALVFNRIVALRDSWSRQDAAVADVEIQTEDDAPVHVGAASEFRDATRQASPQLAAAYERYRHELGISQQEADLLSGDIDTMRFFEDALAAYASPQSIANWVSNILKGELQGDSITGLTFSGADFARLVELVDSAVISANIGKEVLAEMIATGQTAEAIVEERGLRQISDADALSAVISQVMTEYPDKVSAYRDGRTSLLGFFVGQVMRATGGRANPHLVNELLQEKL